MSDSTPTEFVPPPPPDAVPTPPTGTAIVRRRLRFRPPRWWRRGGWTRVLGVLVGLVVLFVVYWLITLVQVWSAGRADHDAPVDAIVVMGAAQYDGRPSPQLQARLDHVVELWSDGSAPLVIVTGGKQPGDRFTEAEASRRYLVDRGVPASAIVGEESGRSSWESLRNVAESADEWGVRTVILVSDPFHSLRIRLIAEELGLVAYTSATDTSPVRGWTAARKHLEESVGVAVGRIVGFERLEGWVG